MPLLMIPNKPQTNKFLAFSSANRDPVDESLTRRYSPKDRVMNLLYFNKKQQQTLNNTLQERNEKCLTLPNSRDGSPPACR
jgi:hypothetical protein